MSTLALIIGLPLGGLAALIILIFIIEHVSDARQRRRARSAGVFRDLPPAEGAAVPAVAYRRPSSPLAHPLHATGAQS